MSFRVRQWVKKSGLFVLVLCAVVWMGLPVNPAAAADGGERIANDSADNDTTDKVEAAIETASQELWRSLAVTDARFKALGVAGSTARGGAEREQRRPRPDYLEKIPLEARYRWAQHVARTHVGIAVHQGRFKVENETTIPGGRLMIISYAVLWVLLLGFTGLLAVRERRLAGELEALERELSAAIADDERTDETSGD